MKHEVVKNVVKQPATKKIGEVILKNSPAILTGISVAGVVSTTIMAVQATPKAIELVRQREYYELELDADFHSLCKKEIIKTAWKCYIPTTIMGGLTIACIISTHTVNHKRNAALASLYSLTEKSLKEYQSKIVETIGENKERKIKDEIRQDTLNKNPVNTKEVIITGKGEMLCYDTLSGRYFKNDIEQIRRVQNDLNYSLRSDMWMSLNDLYYGLGLSAINLGDDIGWSVDEPIDIDFSSMLSSEGEPCLVLDYRSQPISKYR